MSAATPGMLLPRTGAISSDGTGVPVFRHANLALSVSVVSFWPIL
jgi:hypothetical protein